MEQHRRIRITLLVIGFIGFLCSLFLSADAIFAFIDGVEGASFGDIIPAAFLFLISWMILHLAVYWKLFLKSITRFLLTICVVLYSIGLFLFVINLFTPQISHEMQPTIDMVSVQVFDEVIKSRFSYDAGSPALLQLANEEDSTTLKVGEVEGQAFERMVDITNTGELPRNYQKVLVNHAIMRINATVTSQSTLASPVPLTIYGDSLNMKTQVDYNTVRDISPDELYNQLKIRDDATAKVIFDENAQYKEVMIGNISQEDAEIFWEYMNLEHDLSNESKQLMSDVLLSSLNDQFGENQAIPVSSLQYFLPDESKQLFMYDLFSENQSENVKEMEQLRTDCKTNTFRLESLCESVVNTEYRNLISSFEQVDNHTGRNLSAINTLPKLEQSIREVTSIGTWWIGLAMAFLLSAAVVHLRFLEEQKKNRKFMRTARFISKELMSKGAPLMVLTVVAYYVLRTGWLFSFLASGLPTYVQEVIREALELPIIQTLVFSIVEGYLVFLLMTSVVLGAVFSYTHWKLTEEDREHKQDAN